MLSTSFVPYSMEWIRERHQHLCPQDFGVIPDGWSRACNYCPKCKRFWRMRRSKHSGIAMWYFVTLSKTLQEATDKLKGKLSGDTGNSQS
jgi:hypothetical protein